MELKCALSAATALGAAAFAFADSAEDAGTPWKVFPIYGGGYVQNVCMAESDPNRWYCYVDVGGPYRSDDAGAHWYPLHGNFTVAQRAKCADYVRTMSVDPRNADSLVLASGNRFDSPAGVFVSRDGGRTFRQTLLARFYGNGAHRMYGLVLSRNPFNPDELVCGEDMDGLFRSRDNGETWQAIGLDGHWFTDVRYDVTVPGRLWATAPAVSAKALARLGAGPKTRKVGLWRSDDGGDHWQKLSDDPPYELCQVAGEKSVVATWSCCGESDRPKPVKVSSDAGASWQAFGQGLVPYDPPAMTNKFLNEGTYYALAAGPDFLVIGDARGTLYRRGLTDAAWQKIERPPQRLGVPECEARLAHHCRSMEALGSLIVDRRDPNHWLATDWYFIWESHDAGVNWTSRIRGMMQLVSAALDFDPFDREKIRYGVADMGYYCSTNGGRSFFWPVGRATPYAKTIAHSLKTPGLVFATGGKTVTPACWSEDGGVSWRFIKSASGIPRLVVPEHGAYTAAIDPLTDDFYLVVSGPIGPMHGGVYRSHDRGVNWEHFSAGLPAGQRLFKETEWGNCSCEQLVFSPDGSALLVSGLKHLIYRLDRAAGKWVKAPVGYWNQVIVADPHTPGRFILPGVPMQETLDGGKSFHPCWSMPSASWFLAFDARVKGLVVFGHRDALYVSYDGGYHVAPLKDGLRLPSGDSRHVAVNDGRLYLMTSGSGVFTREIPKEP